MHFAKSTALSPEDNGGEGEDGDEEDGNYVDGDEEDGDEEDGNQFRRNLNEEIERYQHIRGFPSVMCLLARVALLADAQPSNIYTI